MASRTAILVGATGLVGSHVLRLLIERYEAVIVLGRSSVGRVGARVIEHLVDFDALLLNTVRLDAEQLRADDFFCCLGTTIRAAGSREAFSKVDRDYVVDLARRTREFGTRRFFLVSALGADPDSLVFYNRVKGETEEAVGDLPFHAVHIVRPSLLLGDRGASRPAERAGQWFGRLVAPLMLGPLGRYRAIEAADVAAALVGCADSDVSGIHVHYPSPSTKPRKVKP